MRRNGERNNNNLVKMSELVEELLVKDESCRNSDAYLYYRVLTEVSAESGIDLNITTVPDFLLTMYGNTLPIFETVRRTRQKTQELHPELCPRDAVQSARNEKKVEYRDYALNYT